MGEWILVITLTSIGYSSGQTPDISPSILGGFHSKNNCNAAAMQISKQMIELSNSARKAQGILIAPRQNAPAIWHDCVYIEK